MKSWKEKKSTPEQMLDDVQDMKEQLMIAYYTDSNKALAEARVDEFMQANREQILDILDDAIYAHLNGKL